MGRGVVAVVVFAAGAGFGVFTLDLARDHPAYWFAGSSVLGGAALLVAGWALITCGVVAWLRRPAAHLGPIVAAAGFGWFVLEWNNPAIGSAVGFTVGLALYAVCAPLVAHAVLVYPTGRLRSPLDGAFVVVGYCVNVLLLGVLPALFFDPQSAACTECPRNLLLVSDRAALADDLARAGVYAGLAWSAAVVLLVITRLEQATPAHRPVLGAGAAYLGLVAAWFATSVERGLLANGTLERRLWLGQAVALVVLSAGIALGWLRARRARDAIARLVVELAESPPPGGLRDALARIVGDADLVLAYPLHDPDRLVDAAGRAVDLPAGREQTTLVRDGRPVAVLAHAPGLLRDEQLVEGVTATARLALENERLQAEVRASLEALRASRARIVEAGDAERKRLERDLHDGAQQRLVGLSLSLRLLRSRLPADGDPATAAALDEADAELRHAIAELRELAHGIFPAVLADEGLAAAVEALAEEARVPIRIVDLPDDRYPIAVETAAYTVVTEAARTADRGLTVRGEQIDGTLVVEVAGGGDLDAVALADRIGALDGHLAVERDKDGRVTIRAELPCGS
jgi:signal transduction histidine kinase